MDTKKIIKKWYATLFGTDEKYEKEFLKALKEIEIDKNLDIDTFEDDGDGKKNLLAFLFMCEKLEKKYEEKGIKKEILLHTLSDIVVWQNEWSEIKGELFLSQCHWLKRHFSMRLFKLGRLQFCMANAHDDIAKYGIKKGDNVIEIHIPKGEPLKREECEKSLDFAREFFKMFFPEFDYKCFTCHSWMLDNTLKEMLDEESNIMQFSQMFDIVEKNESDSILKYVFRYDAERGTIENFAPVSSFAQKVKDKAKSGGKFFEGLGIIVNQSKTNP